MSFSSFFFDVLASATPVLSFIRSISGGPSIVTSFTEFVIRIATELSNSTAISSSIFVGPTAFPVVLPLLPVSPPCVRIQENRSLFCEVSTFSSVVSVEDTEVFELAASKFKACSSLKSVADLFTSLNSASFFCICIRRDPIDPEALKFNDRGLLVLVSRASLGSVSTVSIPMPLEGERGSVDDISSPADFSGTTLSRRLEDVDDEDSCSCLCFDPPPNS
mmetsp:Transcript_13024/g.32882  ORF Transcript_13024/g.32882 Transcript_13024/m.32882 type:complete len:220 (-) Transcript_13024:335-994(-)